MICDRIMRHLPTLLALSVSSPFRRPKNPGLQSHRSKVMEGLPTAGLPTLMRWSEYVAYEPHDRDGFINTVARSRWDVRPPAPTAPSMRVCDMPNACTTRSRLGALVQCLVATSDEIGNGTYSTIAATMVQQNKWRCTRFGNQAKLVDTDTYRSASVGDAVGRLVELLRHGRQ